LQGLRAIAVLEKLGVVGEFYIETDDIHTVPVSASFAVKHVELFANSFTTAANISLKQLLIEMPKEAFILMHSKDSESRPPEPTRSAPTGRTLVSGIRRPLNRTRNKINARCFSGLATSLVLNKYGNKTERKNRASSCQ
jgi:hypothetical protein